MRELQNRHDLTDKQWERIEPIIKERLGSWGGSNANDNRVFVNACLWIVRTGAPWRDLPPQYGKFGAVNRRYKRWCDKGIWQYVLAEIIDEPDMEWLMIDGFEAKALLADRGYDSDEIVAFAFSHGMNAVIPPKKNRKVQRAYDKYLYKLRHLVENAFLKLKRWRGVATRYAKTTSAFCGAVTLAYMMLWLHIVA